MKEIFKKISAILMAVVVLFSTMSFTIQDYYCGDELVNSAFLSKMTACEMDMQMTSSLENCNFEEEDCCSDDTKQCKAQSELETQVLNLYFEQQVFIASFIYTYINLFEGLDNNVVPFKNYTPPFIVKDIQVLDSVFLI